MSELTPITSDTPWLRLKVGPADLAGEDPALLARLLEQLLLIRAFEEKILELHGIGLIHGPAHASIGQEAGAVGAMSVLRTVDKINGTHRAHHQILAKLLNAATPAGYDPRRQPITGEMATMVRRSMAEIMGLSDGFCGGRGGSMHMRHQAAGVPGTSAIIGGNLPQAAGYALADKLLGTGGVSVSFFGDGTLMAGAAYEAMNLAALYSLPVVFFLENNFYAVSTTVAEQTRETKLSSRGPMLGIPAIELDGMDPIAVRKGMQWALDIIARRGGPVMVEAICYRFLHQSGPRPGSEFGYRSKQEEQAWRRRDPVTCFPAALQAAGIIDAELAATLAGRARQVVEAAAEALTEPTPGGNQPRIKPALLPDPATVDSGIRGDLSELAGTPWRELEDYPPEALSEAKFIDSVAEVLVRNMARDPRIVVIGEDVHRLRGGVSGSTKGVLERFPERLFATPICENGFVGMALGAAVNGLRPVVDIMFGDFCLVAADALFNQVAKIRHMFGGDFAVPLVIRVRVSPSAGYGSQHSMDPSGLFALYPGWRIVAPSTPFDYVGLMNTALRCNDPVLVIEHVELFQNRGPEAKDDPDHCLPFGRARIVRRGAACTVLAAAAMVKASVEAAAEAGIDAEVIDLRTLDPLGLDWATVSASLARTHRALVVEQTARGHGIGARIVQEMQERCFDQLDHEILRVTGSLAAPVVSRPLNQAALAGAADIARGLRRVMGQAA